MAPGNALYKDIITKANILFNRKESYVDKDGRARAYTVNEAAHDALETTDGDIYTVFSAVTENTQVMPRVVARVMRHEDFGDNPQDAWQAAIKELTTQILVEEMNGNDGIVKQNMQRYTKYNTSGLT